jgi:putative CRISPR-associated protein (TIGR02619 family)
MMGTPNVLICTVGTSLLRNLQAKGWNVENPIATAKELKKLDPQDKQMGAEINSIYSLIEKGHLEPGRLFLCISDTPDGEITGRILDCYYRDAFEDVKVIKIVGLQAEDPERFRNLGLRNLVKAIADIVKREREHGRELAINATGGFKAQISFAGLIGQLLNVSVYYMFEAFQEVIELPPLPVSFSFDYWLSHFELLERLSQDLLPEEEIPQDLDEVLILREEGLCSLSSLGELFHQGYKERFRRERGHLLPPPSGLRLEEKRVKYEDDNRGKHRGLKEHLERVLRVEYVKRVQTTWYNPGLTQRNRFYVSSACEINQIEGWFSNDKGMTKFLVTTTARSELERQAAVADLTERLLGG